MFWSLYQMAPNGLMLQQGLRRAAATNFARHANPDAYNQWLPVRQCGLASEIDFCVTRFTGYLVNNYGFVIIACCIGCIS